MRVVIKVGTSSLTHKSGHINIRKVENMCKVLSDLKNAGHEIILVSSGAIAMGVGKLNLAERPTDIPTKQAMASIGQCELMYVYDKLFSEYNHTVAQILITIDDMKNERRHMNFQTTMNRLLELGALPIINENDTVSYEEFGIGDNDTLSAFVAVSINADLLILLSDIDGLYTADPHKSADAKLIPVIEKIDDSVISIAGGAGTARGTGGMKTKINAALTVTENGTDMIITNAANIDGLYDILDGKSVGTRFIGKRD